MTRLMKVKNRSEGSTAEPVAVGVVLAALVHRFFVDHQAHVVVTTPDWGEACRIAHLPALHPAGNAQMHPKLQESEKNNEDGPNLE